MAKKPKPATVIVAVAYCRKSTIEANWEKSIADQTARIKKSTRRERWGHVRGCEMVPAGHGRAWMEAW